MVTVTILFGLEQAAVAKLYLPDDGPVLISEIFMSGLPLTFTHPLVLRPGEKLTILVEGP